VLQTTAAQTYESDNSIHSRKQNPSIFGNYIVWEDNRHKDLRIYFYNLGLNREFPVALGEKSQRHPVVHENNIFWSESYLGKHKIESIEISNGRPGGFQPPIFDFIGNQVAQEGVMLNVNIRATDPIETNITISAQLTNGSPLSNIGATFTDDGAGIGLFSWTPQANQSGNYEVRFTASNGLSSTSQIMSIVVEHTADWFGPLVLRPPAIVESETDRIALDGVNLVWVDKRYSLSAKEDIYLKNLTTMEERRITTDAASQKFPAISGPRIVWEDNRHGNLDIYMFNLNTNQEQRITTNTSKQRYPSISGQRIVWNDERHGRTDLYYFDLGTGLERRVTPTISQPLWGTRPVISGNIIAWVDNRDGEHHVYTYNISTNQERRVSTISGTKSNLAISNNRLVWVNWSMSQGSIYLYNIGDVEEIIATTLTLAPLTNTLSIFNDKIVWSAGGLDTRDIFIHHISSNQTRKLTNENSKQTTPVISENWVVWRDFRQGMPIYGYTLSSETLTNAPPTLSQIQNQVVKAGSTIKIDITAYDPNWDTLTLEASLFDGSPLNSINAYFSVSDNLGNSRREGNFVWIPSASQVGTHRIRFRASDGQDVTEKVIDIDVQQHPQTIRLLKDEGIVYHQPIASFNKLAWLKPRPGTFTLYDIIVYDTETQIEQRITLENDILLQSDAFVDIHGNNLVWQNYHKHIYHHNLETNIRRTLSTDDTTKDGPSTSEFRILWTDFPQSSSLGSFTLFDLRTNSATYPYTEFTPNRGNMFGNWISFLSMNIGISLTSRLYFMETASGLEQPIMYVHQSASNAPNIFEDKITYRFCSGGWAAGPTGCLVNVYDIGSGYSHMVNDANAYAISKPLIDRNRVLFSKNQGSFRGLFLYDYDLDEVFLISQLSGSQTTSHAISGDNIIWTNKTTNENTYKIFIYDPES
jgi:TolB protein